MNGLNQISQDLSSVRNNLSKSVDLLHSVTGRISQINQTAIQLIDKSSQHSYRELTGQLGIAQKKLEDAVAFILTADAAAARWLASHVSGPVAGGAFTAPAGGTASSVFSVPLVPHDSIVNTLNGKGVEYRKITPCSVPRSEKEIIDCLGGGDCTKGSCSSLAFAYAGNKAGYNVLDFRGGPSLDFFSQNSSIQEIAELPGVDSTIINGTDDFECTHALLATMIPGKEYYLATAEHAAIVRLTENGYEYLELQSASQNGWHTLTDDVLAARFGCTTSNPYALPNFLIDVESLTESPEFLDILGYLNTAEDQQNKGESGHER